jgi:hypothetical protein
MKKIVFFTAIIILSAASTNAESREPIDIRNYKFYVKNLNGQTPMSFSQWLQCCGVKAVSCSSNGSGGFECEEERGTMKMSCESPDAAGSFECEEHE